MCLYEVDLQTVVTMALLAFGAQINCTEFLLISSEQQVQNFLQPGVSDPAVMEARCFPYYIPHVVQHPIWQKTRQQSVVI